MFQWPTTTSTPCSVAISKKTFPTAKATFDQQPPCGGKNPSGLYYSQNDCHWVITAALNCAEFGKLFGVTSHGKGEVLYSSSVLNLLSTIIEKKTDQKDMLRQVASCCAGMLALDDLKEVLEEANGSVPAS